MFIGCAETISPLSGLKAFMTVSVTRLDVTVRLALTVIAAGAIGFNRDEKGIPPKFAPRSWRTADARNWSRSIGKTRKGRRMHRVLSSGAGDACAKRRDNFDYRT